MIKIRLLLICILILASIARLYKLDTVPFSLNLDEASIGYDAYSILKTGHDQFGKLMPLTFKSTNDFKMPLYIYMTSVSMAIFGSNEFAIRLPSVIAGILGVFLTYLLIREIFLKNKWVEKIALLSALLLTVSPWHLHFSRGAFESNIAVTINLAAILFFLKGLRKNNYLLLISSIFFGLSLFTYHTAKFVTPLILIFMVIINWQPLLSKKKIFIWSALIYFLFILIFMPLAVSKQIQMRFMTLNSFRLENAIYESSQLTVNELQRGFKYSTKLFHNQRLLLFTYDNFKIFLTNYFKHFNPDFIYKGDMNKMYHAPNFGLVLFIEPIFFIFGLFYYLKYLRRRENLFLIWWGLLSFIPSSLVWQAPSSIRSLIFLPLLQLFTAFGVVYLIILIKNKFRQNIFVIFYKVFLVLCVCYSFSSYLHQYYVHLNYEYAESWFFGKKEAVKFTESVKGNYKKIIVSNNRTDWSYIDWLLYSGYNPATYLQKDGGTKSGDFRANESFDKYEFIHFDENDIQGGEGDVLIVGWPEDFKPQAKTLKTVKSIYYPNGKEVLRIVTNH